jgi:hypothetical protein
MVANRLPANQRSRSARLGGLYWTPAGPLPTKTGRERSLFGLQDWLLHSDGFTTLALSKRGAQWLKSFLN